VCGRGANLRFGERESRQGRCLYDDGLYVILTAYSSRYFVSGHTVFAHRACGIGCVHARQENEFMRDIDTKCYSKEASR
jgi:hypothetical protein